MIGDRIKRARSEMVKGLVAKGATKKDAEEAVGKIGDGQILAWLLLHGPKFLEVILKLL